MVQNTRTECGFTTGPYLIQKALGPLSYRIDVDGKPRSVHAKFLKENAVRVIKRVTTMLDDDKPDDDVTITNGKLHLEGTVVNEARQKDVDAWASEFGDVICQEPGLTDLIELSIDTGGAPPISQRPYNTPMFLREAVSTENDWLLEKGYVRPTNSDWALPIVTVKKPDDSLRLCIDYKRLNDVTVPAPSYMPTVEVLESVGTACVISKLDLNKGYHKVKVREEDIGKTAFVCHRGHFEFLRMSFGFKNAPAAFQKLTSKVLEPCRDFAHPYIDDIVVFSSSWEEHVGHVREVLSRLREAGLTASPKKCRWGGRFVEILGHKLGEGMMSIPNRRVEAIRSFVRPRTKNFLRSFLGCSCS